MDLYAGVTGQNYTPELQAKTKLYAGVTGQNHTPELQAKAPKTYAGVTGYCPHLAFFGSVRVRGAINRSLTNLNLSPLVGVGLVQFGSLPE
jgi:hypothetical protein